MIKRTSTGFEVSVKLTEQQFNALYAALAGRVEDAECGIDPDRPQDDHYFVGDLSLKPVMEQFDAYMAEVANG